MPSFQCDCGKHFKGFQYYMQHLSANEYCQSAIKPDGTRHPVYGRKMEMIEKIDNVIKGEEEKQGGDGLEVFDFVDDDGPPCKRIRVGTLKAACGGPRNFKTTGTMNLKITGTSAEYSDLERESYEVPDIQFNEANLDFDESKLDSNESKFDSNFRNLDMGEPMLGNLEGTIGLESDKIPTSSKSKDCLLYTSPSPRDLSTSRMPSSA